MIEKEITNLGQITVLHNEVLTVFQLLPGSESPEVSLALIELSGINQKVSNRESDAIYMIVAGSGCFILWDGEDHEVREVQVGDSVRIPAGTPYQDVGRMLMVCMNKRAFDPEKVEYFD